MQCLANRKCLKLVEFALIITVHHYNIQLLLLIVVEFILLLLIQLVSSLPKPVHPAAPSKSSRETGSNDRLSPVQRPKHFPELTHSTAGHLSGSRGRCRGSSDKEGLMWITSQPDQQRNASSPGNLSPCMNTEMEKGDRRSVASQPLNRTSLRHDTERSQLVTQ